MRYIVLSFLTSLALLGCEQDDRRPEVPQASTDEIIHYASTFGFHRLSFDERATRVTGVAADADDMPLLDCSNEAVVCRTLPGGPIFIAIARDLADVTQWSAGEYSFVVMAREPGRAAGSQIIFVEQTSSADPTWKQAFTYETGIGVTAFTFNFDDESQLSESAVLVGPQGILHTLE